MARVLLCLFNHVGRQQKWPFGIWSSQTPSHHRFANVTAETLLRCPEIKLPYLICDVWLLDWMWISLVGSWLKLYLLCQARPYSADAGRDEPHCL